MQLTINFERRHLYAFILLTCLLLGGLIAYATVANGLYHNVGDTFVMGGAGSTGGIIDGTILAGDTDTSSVQSRVTGTCAGSNFVQSIGAGGTVGCAAESVGITSCTVFTGSAGGTGCSASCGGGLRLMGGGCRCAAGTSAIFTSYITSIGAGGFSGTWGCTCAVGGCEAIVECCA